MGGYHCSSKRCLKYEKVSLVFALHNLNEREGAFHLVSLVIQSTRGVFKVYTEDKVRKKNTKVWCSHSDFNFSLLFIFFQKFRYKSVFLSEFLHQRSHSLTNFLYSYRFKVDLLCSSALHLYA